MVALWTASRLQAAAQVRALRLAGFSNADVVQAVKQGQVKVLLEEG
jgi:hypothetical protein